MIARVLTRISVLLCLGMGIALCAFAAADQKPPSPKAAPPSNSDPLVPSAPPVPPSTILDAAPKNKALPTEALRSLVEALSDSDERVRREAAAALVLLGKHEEGADRKRIIAALVGGAKDSKNRDRRANAVYVLGVIQAREAADQLGKAVKDADTEVRLRATWALRMIAGGMDLLEKVCDKPNGDFEKEAKAARAMLKVFGIPEFLFFPTALDLLVPEVRPAPK